MFRTTILCSLAALTSAIYVIQDDYEPSTFASRFDFFTDDDPTHGYVNYVDQNTAQTRGLYSTDNHQVYMGVDHSNVASGRGRDSIRISSKSSYNHGLFILDLAHMPGGQCGTWPAFWLLGPNWVEGGEVDIIEGVNSKKANGMALHTTPGCTVTNQGQFTGELIYANCDIHAPSQPYNTGCSINATRDDSYGTGFNAVGGGVYATEWTSDYFAIWYFPRSRIPADITAGNPAPDNWGLPSGQFSGNCDIDSKFRDQQIIFDITFCGDWAGYDWNFDTTCNTRASSCNNYVQNNPTDFSDTYWRINSLKVFQDNGFPATSATSSMTLSTRTAATSMQTTTTRTTLAATTTTTATASSARTTVSTTTASTTNFPNITTSTSAVTSTTINVNTTAVMSTVHSMANSSDNSAAPSSIIPTNTTITISASPVTSSPSSSFSSNTTISASSPSSSEKAVQPVDTEIITLTTIITTCFPTTTVTPVLGPPVQGSPSVVVGGNGSNTGDGNDDDDNSSSGASGSSGWGRWGGWR